MDAAFPAETRWPREAFSDLSGMTLNRATRECATLIRQVWSSNVESSMCGNDFKASLPTGVGGVKRNDSH